MYALIDCNCFFASCEKVFNPKLKNKPVVVLSNNDGCIVTRTREVKALGVPMGAPYFKWKRLLEYHNVHVFSSNFELYGDMSDRVMATLSQFAPDIEYYSIDEAFLSLKGFEKRDLDAYGRKMKKIIYQWTGIPVSVGIGATKTLAKVATEYAKSNHQTGGVCDLSSKTKDETDHILKDFPVEEIWGIGRQSAKLLKKFSIHNAYDFSRAPESWIKRKMSITGLRTARELRGIASLSLEENLRNKKSILSSRSFGKRITTKKELSEAVSTHVARTAEKLRKQKSVASSITVFIKTGKHNKNETYYSNAKTIAFEEPTAHTGEMILVALNALDQIFKKGHRYKKAGVYLGGISKQKTMQRPLFEENFYGSEKRNLMDAIDKINLIHGRNSIMFAAEGAKKPWRMKRDHTSGRYTSKWEDLLRVS